MTEQKRRFRLDSATDEEIVDLVSKFTASRAYADHCDPKRGARLMVHWWALGHDPARALRCPRCKGEGDWLEGRCALTGKLVYHACPACSGRGWSLPSERGER